MNMFSDWDEDYEPNEGSWLFHDEDGYPDGHPKSAFKDDGDMKLFKDDE